MTDVNEALVDFAPIAHRDDTVARACRGDPVRVYEELEILHALDEPKSMTGLQQELKAIPMIQNIVSHLAAKGDLTMADKRRERRSTTICR